MMKIQLKSLIKNIKTISLIIITNIVPALNWANYWKLLFSTLSAVNNQILKFDWIFRDYTPSLICYNCFLLNINIHLSYPNSNHTKNFTNISQYSSNWSIDNSNTKIELLETEKFSYYLIGLIEGDGTIVVPKVKRTKGRLNYPSIKIVFQLKDLPLALLIQKELKHGSLARKKGVNAYIFTTNDYKGILLLISLINGKMKTSKIHSLYNLIDWYNLKDPCVNLDKKCLDKTPLASNPWLSGFIEADGHFSIRASSALASANNFSKVECKFELSQRQVDHKGYNNIEFL